MTCSAAVLVHPSGAENVRLPTLAKLAEYAHGLVSQGAKTGETVMIADTVEFALDRGALLPENKRILIRVLCGKVARIQISKKTRASSS